MNPTTSEAVTMAWYWYPIISLAVFFFATAFGIMVTWGKKPSATTPPATAPTATGTAAPPVIVPDTKRSGSWFWIVIGLLIVAVAAYFIYQSRPSPSVAGATPATIPAPTATAPKATADEGKGTVVDVPEKVPGDNAWKHAYIFQLKSGYFRFSWDITAVDPKDRDVNWEIRLEKTGQVVSLTDIRSGKVKNPAIPQNSWIRIRAERPIKVKVSTAW